MRKRTPRKRQLPSPVGRDGVSPYWKLFCVILVFILCLILTENYYAGHYWTDSIYPRIKPTQPNQNPSPIHEEKMEGKNDHVGICNIPKLTAWNNVTKSYWKNYKKINCSKNSKYPPIFTTDLNSTLIRLVNPSKFKLGECCYKEILTNFSDNDERLVNNCIPIKEARTLLPQRVQAFHILCKNMGGKKDWQVIDVLGFARCLNRHTVARVRNYSKNFQAPSLPKPNIIIFGMDSTSHMNLQRILPKTFAHMTKNMGAIGMNGYVKVGLNTLPNMVAALSGKTVAELEQTDRNQLVPLLADKLVWKKFEAEGYVTAFAEDAADGGMFTYRRGGFLTQPTDFYGRALFRQAEKFVGHRFNGYAACYGHHSGLDFIFDFMKQVSLANEKFESAASPSPPPYFKLVWSSALFHNDQSLGQVADDDILKILKWYRSSSPDKMNRTVFIFMSDHGARFGAMRQKTSQGHLEDQMPFLYFIFPSWFKKKFQTALANLRGNVDRLTSHFDLHQTLVDLSNLDQISDTMIQKRGRELRSMLDKNEYPKGISLMLPIPKRRLCQQAGIPSRHCVCQTSKNLNLTGPRAKDIGVAVKMAVSFINQQFNHHNVTALCEKLVFDKILSAQEIIFDSDNFKKRLSPKELTENIQIKFYTKPGSALFEAQLTRTNQKKGWTMEGGVGRLNEYGNQSSCVSDKRTLKPVCFCKRKKEGGRGK